jgi:hypothetical protein
MNTFTTLPWQQMTSDGLVYEVPKHLEILQ